MKAIFILLLVFSQTCFAQHTDLKEYGLSGKVKKLVTRIYDSCKLENGQWRPPDEKNFRSSVSYFYDAAGMIDSMHYLLRMGDELVKLRTVYEFSNGRKSGSREYNGLQLEETATFLWVDNFSYIIRATREGEKETVESWQWLNPSYRDLKGELRVLKEDGTLGFCSDYENKLEGNRIISAVITDCITNEKKSREYSYYEMDAAGNPRVTVITEPGNKKPFQLALRQFEYF